MTNRRPPNRKRASERFHQSINRPPQHPSDLATIGINRAMRPLDYGAANLADARAYHERLAARGERDES